MTIILADQQTVAELEAMVAEWVAGPYQAGIYQGDPGLDHTAVIGDITPCTAPGGDALIDLTTWAAVTITDGVALAWHAGIVWTCTGGGPVVICGGVYVVAPGPRLAWVERFAAGPILVGSAGQEVSYQVRRTHRSQLLQG